MRGSRGGGGAGGGVLKNHKNIGFLSKTGPDPLKMTKLPSQHSMSGYHRHAGGPMMTRLYDYLDPLIMKKTLLKLDPPLT